MERAVEIHGDLYDYSNVRKEDIVNCGSEICVICKKCKSEWTPSVNNHLNSKSGCPICNISRSESMTCDNNILVVYSIY